MLLGIGKIGGFVQHHCAENFAQQGFVHGDKMVVHGFPLQAAWHLWHGLQGNVLNAAGIVGMKPFAHGRHKYA